MDLTIPSLWLNYRIYGSGVWLWRRVTIQDNGLPVEFAQPGGQVIGRQTNRIGNNAVGRAVSLDGIGSHQRREGINSQVLAKPAHLGDEFS